MIFPCATTSPAISRRWSGACRAARIRAGLPVFRSDLIEPFQVQRGDLVDVTAISGAAQLHLPAVAETSGQTRRHDLAQERPQRKESSARESKEKTKRWWWLATVRSGKHAADAPTRIQ